MNVRSLKRIVRPLPFDRQRHGDARATSAPRSAASSAYWVRHAERTLHPWFASWRCGVVALFAVAGCYQQVNVDDPDGSPPPWDAGTRFVAPAGKCVDGAPVDLLLVVDDSNSLTEEQELLAASLPLLVESLVNPPDEDLDGRPDWEPVTDLQVGVITPDMGTGEFDVPTCSMSDDGVLLTEGRSDVTGCAPLYPSVQRFVAGGALEPAAFAREVACVSRTGTMGCGYEQPLEALLKALTPSSSDLRFEGDTVGHGDGANAGFVRSDSLLAVVVVTDEEDCSARNYEIFNPSSPEFSSDLSLRCFSYPDQLHPIDRYVDGLVALRRDRPDLLAFAVIAGVPPDLTSVRETDADLFAMLADPRLEERVDPDSPTRLIASCDTPDTGLAFPPRRLIQVARRLGASRATVQSLCQADLMPAARAIAAVVGGRSCHRYED